jgi:hypothetical protein
MTTANNQVAFDTNGTLGRVWLAAHWDKRLTKNSISSHDISESVAVIKAPGNVYSLRISGFLLLGLVKIYSKKSIITQEEAEQALSLLTQTPTATNPEVLKEIGLTEVPEKLKLAPVKKPEMFNPIVKAAKPPPEKAKPVAKEKVIPEPQAEENDILGVTTSFLDDVEMAEQWLRKDEKEVDVELPAKRPREKVWQNFINTNYLDNEVIMPDPPSPRAEIEPIINKIPSLNANPDPVLPSTSGNTSSQIKTEEISETPNNDSRPNENKGKKPRSQHAKQVVKDIQFDLVINPEANMGLDCTSDIVKNTRLFQPLAELLPNDMEQIFYIPLFKDMAPELENFYISHVKIQRLKNAFREEEEKEPVILSNLSNGPNDVVMENTQIAPQNTAPAQDHVEPAKVEKPEEKNDETWSSRTLKLLKLLKVRLASQKFIFFDELSKKLDRRVMACGFYEVLQLCLKDFIILESRDKRIMLKPTERLMRLNIM